MVIGLGFGEQRVEAIDTCAPEVFVAGQQRPGAGDHGRVRADEAFAAFRALDDEARLLEDADVLLHAVVDTAEIVG